MTLSIARSRQDSIFFAIYYILLLEHDVPPSLSLTPMIRVSKISTTVLSRDVA
jgi:hypothetical protein